MKVKVYTNRAELLREPVKDDVTQITVGSGIYGERYDGLALSPLARRELAQAQRLIEWYEHFLCRFEEKADVEELKGLLRKKN